MTSAAWRRFSKWRPTMPRSSASSTVNQKLVSVCVCMFYFYLLVYNDTWLSRLIAVRSEAAGHGEQGPSDPRPGCRGRLQSGADARRALFIHNSRPLRWWDRQHLTANLFLILTFISIQSHTKSRFYFARSSACLNIRWQLYMCSQVELSLLRAKPFSCLRFSVWLSNLT